MQKIESKDNKRLKFVRRVGARKEQDHLFFEGLRLIREVLEKTDAAGELYLSDQFADSNKEFIERIPAQRMAVFNLAEDIFRTISRTKTSQGIILITKRPGTGARLIENRITSDRSRIPLVLLLHRIASPSNLGAILRTAEAADVSGVVVTKDSADPFSPSSLRSSMGAAVRLAVWERADFIGVLDWGKGLGLTPTAADIGSRTLYSETDWTRPRLVVFGSESRGLGADDLSLIEDRIVIPMKNDVESLNIAVSCGIILFEYRRQNDLTASI